MANTLAVHHRSNRPVTARLHPAVYKFAAGLVLLFVASAWAFFYQQGDPQLLLGMVTELLFVAVAIPFLLWLTWRRHRTTEEVRDATEVTSLRAWMFGDFDTWQGRLRARDAMIDILLPLAAVSVGLMSIGIVFAIDAYMFS